MSKICIYANDNLHLVLTRCKGKTFSYGANFAYMSKSEVLHIKYRWLKIIFSSRELINIGRHLSSIRLSTFKTASSLKTGSRF